MKKWIASLMALLMLVGMLAGCGAKDDDKKSDNKKETTAQTEAPKETEAPEETEAPKATKAPKETEAPTKATKPAKQEAAVGELLDAPETQFDENTTELAFLLCLSGETEEDDIQVDIKVKDFEDDSSIIYVADGMISTKEIVYEIAADGTIVKYARGMFDDYFIKDTAASQDELNAEIEGAYEVLAMPLMLTVEIEGLQLRKLGPGAPTLSMTGDAYAYEVIEDGEITGYVSVHKETGLIVDMRDPDGNSMFFLMDLQTSGIEFPEYK